MSCPWGYFELKYADALPAKKNAIPFVNNNFDAQADAENELGWGIKQKDEDDTVQAENSVNSLYLRVPLLYPFQLDKLTNLIKDDPGNLVIFALDN